MDGMEWLVMEWLSMDGMIGYGWNSCRFPYLQTSSKLFEVDFLRYGQVTFFSFKPNLIKGVIVCWR